MDAQKVDPFSDVGGIRDASSRSFLSHSILTCKLSAQSIKMPNQLTDKLICLNSIQDSPTIQCRWSIRKDFLQTLRSLSTCFYKKLIINRYIPEPSLCAIRSNLVNKASHVCCLLQNAMKLFSNNVCIRHRERNWLLDFHRSYFKKISNNV